MMKYLRPTKIAMLWSMILFSLILLNSTPYTSYALSKERLELLNQGVNYYDIESCETAASVSGASEGGPLSGVKFPEVSDKKMLADAINSYIKKGWPRSPLVDWGDKYVLYGEKYNVNPLIAVVISQVEYQFGTARTDLVGKGGPGQYNYWAVTHNSNSSTRFGQYDSIDQAMEAHFKLLSGDLYIGPPSNFTTVKQIMNRYAPSFENNTAGYIDTIIKGMKKIVEGGGVTAESGAAAADTTESTTSTCECSTAKSDEPGATKAISNELLSDLANVHGGNTTISVKSIDGSIDADTKGNVQMPTRSSYKIYTAYATLRAIEAGRISWGTTIWSGKNVEETMEAMIVSSDNDAAAALRTDSRIGTASAVTNILQGSVGLSKKTVMGSGSAGDASGTNSKSTANDFTKFLVQLEKKKLDGVKKDDSYEKLLSFMKVATTDGSSARAGIAAGANGAVVADKPGWAGAGADSASNDVGIVYLKDKPYAVAILSDKPNQWEGVAKIAESINSAMGGAAGDSTCGSSAAVGDFPSTIQSYAWPEYHAAPFHERKPAYAEAVKKAIAQRKYVGGSVAGVAGIDCGGFVTLAMINSGYEPNYNAKGKGGNTIYQKQWLDENWKKVTISSTQDLEPGDVAMSTSHTFMHIGEIEGFDSVFASASYSTSGNGRAPMSGQGDAMTPGKWIWYRKK